MLRMRSLEWLYRVNKSTYGSTQTKKRVQVYLSSIMKCLHVIVFRLLVCGTFTLKSNYYLCKHLGSLNPAGTHLTI